MPSVVRSILIKAPPSVVWRWLASQAALRQWISPNLQIDLRVGGAYRFLGPDDETWISGQVLELTPERALVLSWLEEGGGWVNPARLVFKLSAAPGGAEVSMVHDGFENIGTPGWAKTEQAYERGADRHRILERLAELVAADAPIAGAGV